MWNAREIDTAFIRPGGHLELEESLESEYDRRTEKAARRQIVLALLLMLALTTVGLLSDIKAGIFFSSVMLKFSVQIPVILFGIAAAWRLPMKAGSLWLAGGLPITVTVAVIAVLAVETVSPMSDRYLMIAGLAAVAGNVALPIKFRQSVLATGANITALIAIPILADPFADVLLYIDILLFMSAIALATTILVHSRERSQKRAFLLSLTNERQTMELQSLVNDLAQLAHRDPLTGAGNRRSFAMRYEATWRAAALRHEQVALVLVDIDHFKLFNDAAGHQQGDSCLIAVAQAIATGARSSIETVARYGGEEFALVLQSTTGDTAEAIRSSVAELALPHPGLPPGSIVTVSVGKAFAFPAKGQDSPDDLLRAADEALYEAKKTGRNRVVVRGRSRIAAA